MTKVPLTANIGLYAIVEDGKITKVIASFEDIDIDYDGIDHPGIQDESVPDAAVKLVLEALNPSSELTLPSITIGDA